MWDFNMSDCKFKLVTASIIKEITVKLSTFVSHLYNNTKQCLGFWWLGSTTCSCHLLDILAEIKVQTKIECSAVYLYLYLCHFFSPLLHFGHKSGHISC